MINSFLRHTLHAYAAYIGLPVFMMDRDGEIVYSVHAGADLVTRVKPSVVFDELIQIVQSIKEPTVLTSNEPGVSYRKFLLSPFFTLESGSYSLLIGPFLEEGDDREAGISVFSRQQRQEAIEKVTHLFLFMTMLSEQLKAVQMNEVAEKLRKHVQTNKKIFSSYLHYLHAMYDVMVQTSHIDFLGHATRQDDAAFQIDVLVGGSHQNTLNESLFFVGEGPLGLVAALGEERKWASVQDTHRASFFQKFSFYPAALFAYPVLQNGQVDEVFFGGTFHSNQLNDAFLQVTYSMFPYFYNQRIFYEQQESLKQKSLLIESVADWVSILIQTNNATSAVHKLLDICLLFNGGQFVCFTPSAGKEVVRGEKDTVSYEQHRRQFGFYAHGEKRKQTVHTEQGTLIHQPVYVQEVFFGLVTAQLPEGLFFEEQREALELMGELINGYFAVKEEQAEKGKKPVVPGFHQEDPSPSAKLAQISQVADIKSAIDTLALTSREKEVLHLVLEGFNNHEIASYLNISNHTVKNHITNIFKKMNVTDRMQAMVKVYRIKYEE